MNSLASKGTYIVPTQNTQKSEQGIFSFKWIYENWAFLIFAPLLAFFIFVPKYRFLTLKIALALVLGYIAFVMFLVSLFRK